MPPLNPWVSQLRPNPRASLRLFCFPYAGGGAAPYRPWADVLPRNVEVCPIQLPGREMRIKQTAFSDVFALVDALVSNIVPLLDRPFALFGHSMGALVAFELTRRLMHDRHPLPERLFVSARVAPSVQLKFAPIHKLPDDELIREIVKLNGTDKDVVGQTELMKLILPTLRADLALHEEYRYSAGPLLECPIVAFGGLQDFKVDAEDLDAWRNHTSGPFTKRMLAGDHFFISAPQSSFVNLLALELQKSVANLGSRITPTQRSLQTA
jgi:medium-chain acyl-[acyl-carrier-protein] hydrolase